MKLIFHFLICKNSKIEKRKRKEKKKKLKLIIKF